ncbi:MAG: hypothetical protein AAGD14_01810 [Planctomycetota bacterium]
MKRFDAWLVLFLLFAASCGRDDAKAPAPRETLEEALSRVNPDRDKPFGEKARAVDAGESRDVREFIVRALDLPGPVRWNARRSATRLSFYGITDEAALKTILETLREEQKRRGWRPIRVRFFASESKSSHEHPSGGTITQRVDGPLIREQWIW